LYIGLLFNYMPSTQMRLQRSQISTRSGKGVTRVKKTTEDIKCSLEAKLVSALHVEEELLFKGRGLELATIAALFRPQPKLASSAECIESPTLHVFTASIA
jgi:hypothetical protein